MPVPRAFTPASIASIARLLSPPPRQPLPPHTAADPRSGACPRDAAVLVPLVNVGGIAHVLMEVRAGGLRVHAGEASFPGGKVDPTDSSLAHTALRETHEELGLDPACVDVLGALGAPEYSLGNRTRVWAFVGFVRGPDTDANEFPLSILRPSAAEVAAVLPLPLAALTDAARLTTHYFRLDPARPYHKIRAGDYAVPVAAWSGRRGAGLGRPTGALDVNAHAHAYGGPPIDPLLEVWGLSGWFLSQLAARLGWLAPPPLYVPDD
ncbi:hypothetical protein Q5752_004986 [Cryptotrichosporon argae]